MACTQTLSGLTRDCAPSKGGVVEVYLANYDDVASVTLTDGKVSAITMVSTAKFKKYAFAPQTAFMSGSYQINNENGTKYVLTQLQMVFSRMETTKRIEVSAIAQGLLVAMVKDANGAYWYLGYDEPLQLSDGGLGTGTNRADRNGYTVTLDDNSDEPPYEINVGTSTGQVDLSDIVG